MAETARRTGNDRALLRCSMGESAFTVSWGRVWLRAQVEKPAEAAKGRDGNGHDRWGHGEPPARDLAAKRRTLASTATPIPSPTVSAASRCGQVTIGPKMMISTQTAANAASPANDGAAPRPVRHRVPGVRRRAEPRRTASPPIPRRSPRWRSRRTAMSTARPRPAPRPSPLPGSPDGASTAIAATPPGTAIDTPTMVRTRLCIDEAPVTVLVSLRCVV